jgi:hypothetical protein
MQVEWFYFLTMAKVTPTATIAKKRAEARCRYYTRDEALRLGWNVNHPSGGGSLLEEQELVDFYPPLKKTLGGEKPDFAIVSDTQNLIVVIECKNDYREVDTAVAEAIQYANSINAVRGFDVKICIGVAGTPDTRVLTRIFFRAGDKWEPLKSHGYPLSQIPNPYEVKIALELDDGTTDVQLPNEREFFDAAIQISRILRLAKIEELVRPRILGAIILALYQGEFNFSSSVVLEQINANVKGAIESFEDISEKNRRLLTDTLHLSTEADAIRDSIHNIVYQLERLNVRSIMRSGVDFLGKFYEAFLRYGSDSNKMGIVFTPRHITKFCAELTDVRLGMEVYDPASGTGGFLVAAFDKMMKKATTPTAKRKVKESLYGSDTNSTVWALSLLNLFFRGDGKSHIEKKSCFANESLYTNRFDRVLMNPPFNQEGEPEITFIDHSLKCLIPGGEAAIVVKTGVMVDDELGEWRKDLISKHQILAVITLPVDLFYPTSAPTVIIVFQAYSPDIHRGTFVARIQNDGYEISKKKRIERKGSQLEEVLGLYQQFLTRGKINVRPNVAYVVERDLIINGQEVCAECWLPSAEFTKQDYENWQYESMKQMSLAVANYPDVMEELIPDFKEQLESISDEARPSQRTTLDSWFEVVIGKSAGHKNYSGGTIPYVSSGDSYNSIVEFIQSPNDEVFDSPCITVTAFGQASIQPWRFAARGNGGSAVRVLRPRFSMSLEELFWFVGQINYQRWRFHYARMAIKSRLERLEVDPPPKSLPPIGDLGEKLYRFYEELRYFWEKQVS